MKMRAFVYHRPETLDEALALLATHGGDAKVIAGGQSLLPMMAMRLSSPAYLVDIGAIASLSLIDAAGVPGRISTGANVRHADIIRSADVSDQPLLARVAPLIGHGAIRNRGTVCGSIAHADPAAEWPAVALALDAEMLAVSASGSRIIKAADFFQGFLTTAVRDEELVTHVHWPCALPREGSAVHEVSRRHGDFAMCGAVAVLALTEHGVIDRARIAALGVATTPVRAIDAEDILIGQMPTAAVFAAAAASASRSLDPSSDLHATAAYRRHVTGSLIARCLIDAHADITAKELSHAIS